MALSPGKIKKIVDYYVKNHKRDNFTMEAMGQYFHVHPKTLSYKLIDAGVYKPKRSPREYTKEQQQAMIDDYLENQRLARELDIKPDSLEKIGNRHGATNGYLGNLLRRRGIRQPSKECHRRTTKDPVDTDLWFEFLTMKFR